MAELFADRAAPARRPGGDRDRRPDRACRIPQWRPVRRSRGASPARYRRCRARARCGLAARRRVACADRRAAGSPGRQRPRKARPHARVLAARQHSGRRHLGGRPRHCLRAPPRRRAAAQGDQRRDRFLACDPKRIALRVDQFQEHPIMEGVTIVDHPLVQHKLTLVRDKSISTKSFRELIKEIGMLLCYEVTRDLPLTDTVIDTPLATMHSAKIAGKKLVFVPMLRAGTTFVDGMMDLVPTARVAHIGLYREPHSFAAVEYFFKSPSDLGERLAIVVTPVVATANTAVAAIDRLKERGAKDIRLACLIAAPEGLERLRGLHPDVPIWTAAVDEGLDENGFILPGLGDAGDRDEGILREAGSPLFSIFRTHS